MSVDHFQDIASSAKVDGNCRWILYEHGVFGGRSYIVDPGSYLSAQLWGGPGNQLSSLRVLPPRRTSAIVLFEHSNFNGRMLVFYHSHSNLVNEAFNDKPLPSLLLDPKLGLFIKTVITREIAVPSNQDTTPLFQELVVFYPIVQICLQCGLFGLGQTINYAHTSP